MALITSKYVWGVALQSGQGSAASVPQHRILPTGDPSLAPNVEASKRDQYGTSRDGGKWEINRISVGGDITIYPQIDTFPLIAYAVLGSKAAALLDPAWAASTAKTTGSYINAGAGPYAFEATSGGTTGATQPTWPTAVGATVVDGTVTWTNRGLARRNHTNTPADDQAWFTMWRFAGGVIAEKFVDCKITALNLTGQNGQSLQAALTIAGFRYADETATIAYDPYSTTNTGGGTLDSSPVIRYPGMEISLAGTRNRRISQFGWNLQAAQNTQQTDEIYDSIMEPGSRTLEVSWTETATDASRYKRTVYNPNGQPLSSIQHDPLKVIFRDELEAARLTLDVPHFAYQSAPLPFSTGGDLPNTSVTGAADIPTDGSPITTLATTNGVAGYSAAA